MGERRKRQVHRVNEVIDRQIRGLTKVLVRMEDASEVRGRSSVHFLSRRIRVLGSSMGEHVSLLSFTQAPSVRAVARISLVDENLLPRGEKDLRLTRRRSVEVDRRENARGVMDSSNLCESSRRLDAMIYGRGRATF